ncbi:MAG TPA: 6-phosphofructokinase [Candidatus Fraserbacteria bacterium]|nr:6-phosphofructokinase [Candidatus Fraserbacteria bacterium]
MQRIGVLTSGGDAPGMNAALRAVTREALARRAEVVGIRHGFAGIVRQEFIELSRSRVGGILERGGTILQTARYEEFKRPERQRQARAILRDQGLIGLIVIGGDGSFRAAQRLHLLGLPTIGIPATIDNDIPGTDMAIGVDTALNTVIRAIDRIRDTATSHSRAFVVEVMGRRSGYLALAAGLAAGAEIILVPEVPLDLRWVVSRIKRGEELGKQHSIIVVAEGVCPEGSAGYQIAREIAQQIDYEIRVTVLGHVQRGGSPSVFDRLLAVRLGAAAVDRLLDGSSGQMVALQGNAIITKKFSECLRRRKRIDRELLKLAHRLAAD